MRKIRIFIRFAFNMGWVYTLYRIRYELYRSTGLLRHKYPVDFKPINFITLKEWRKNYSPFFFDNREEIKLSGISEKDLKLEFNEVINGRINFFSSTKYDLGNNYDWVTNPDNKHKYDVNIHWTDIQDFSKEAGDIKYVWEKSRFGYLYTVIRYDQRYNQDNSKYVFNEIISWINLNPLNCGPNYISSQEICIRILNWVFALYFYKDSNGLNEVIFQKIINSIYRQMEHVYKNINFSRKTVRNNHAITETFTLYLIGLLFPDFNYSEMWRKNGKKWFEKEIKYQIYEDGTYIQYSMNYHRVVVQLLTWAFYLSELNDDKFSKFVYQKAARSLEFLLACQNKFNGQLPNYGANDGSLFFPLNNCEYRDYRPQLNAIYYYFMNCSLYGTGDWNEDLYWFNSALGKKRSDNNSGEYILPKIKLPEKANSFSTSGYYTIIEEESLLFARCGNHKDRPSQADNLHLDFWYKNINVLLDGGTYKYNTDDELMKYFYGTSSHNTIMLDDYDQMLKGPRFIWLYWTQANYGSLTDSGDKLIFEGEIRAFNYLRGDIKVKRKITKYKGLFHIIVEDTILNKPAFNLHQIWNTRNPSMLYLNSNDSNCQLTPSIKNAWYSDRYGVKLPSTQIIYTTSDNFINTEIKLKD